MHANNIRGWCAAVDKRYKEFSVRMEKYRTRLEETLGVHQEEEVVNTVVIKRRYTVNSTFIDIACSDAVVKVPSFCF